MELEKARELMALVWKYSLAAKGGMKGRLPEFPAGVDLMDLVEAHGRCETAGERLHVTQEALAAAYLLSRGVKGDRHCAAAGGGFRVEVVPN